MAKTRPNNTPKLALAVLASAPFAWLVYLIALEIAQPTSGLGPEPAEGLLHYLGEWSMIMLLVAFSLPRFGACLNSPYWREAAA